MKKRNSMLAVAVAGLFAAGVATSTANPAIADDAAATQSEGHAMDGCGGKDGCHASHHKASKKKKSDKKKSKRKKKAEPADEAPASQDAEAAQQ